MARWPPGSEEAPSMKFRSCLLALILVSPGPWLAAGCGGTSPRPRDGAASGGSQGGEGGQGGSDPGDQTGGRGGSQAGGSQGGSGGGGRGGSGGSAGSGGQGGSGNAGGKGGSAGGTGGTGMAGKGGSGAGGSGTDAKLDTPKADAPGATDAPLDSAPGPDVAPADTAPAVDTPPVGASCGGVTCPRLWQLIESCRPMGACTQQMVLTMVNRCYANQVKVRARVDIVNNVINSTFVKTDGSSCYLMDTPLGGGGAQVAIIKELNGTEVARVTVTESTAVSCAGGPVQTLSDSTCVPSFSLTECAQGACQ
jgi:hypothetical protein